MAGCVLGCFFGLGLTSASTLRLWDGRVATFNVDPMLMVLSVMGAAAFLAGMVQSLFESWFCLLGEMSFGLLHQGFWSISSMGIDMPAALLTDHL